MLALALLLIGAASAESSDNPVMDLVMMDDYAASHGAVCIDGTPAGFYWGPGRPATPSSSSSSSSSSSVTSWQIHFMGGGWCYDEVDCLGRSNGGLGSSKGWKNTSTINGIMSGDCDANPDFCNFNRVHLVYCDGNSFSGDRDDAVVVQGKPLFFRGRRILDAALETLVRDYGLGDATEGHVPTLQTFKAAPVSGFFLQHDTVEGKPVYPEQMRTIFYLSNATGGVNEACVAAYPNPDDQWQCNMAEHAYAHTESAIFPLNSALDSWQTVCIFTSELVAGFPNQTSFANGDCGSAATWGPCAQNPESCDATQIKAMNTYIQDFDHTMASGTHAKKGNGAFIHSCHTHCEALSDASWNGFQVNGVSMQAAVSRWWKSGGDDPAATHSFTPCLYKDGTSDKPRMCNPTCVADAADVAETMILPAPM
eukprot:g2126.t1